MDNAGITITITCIKKAGRIKNVPFNFFLVLYDILFLPYKRTKTSHIL